MTGTVNNGQMLDVTFGAYAGKAAVVDDGKSIEVAFFADFKALRRVEAGEIDGKPHRVIAVDKGAADRGLKGMVILTVERVQ